MGVSPPPSAGREVRVPLSPASRLTHREFAVPSYIGNKCDNGSPPGMRSSGTGIPMEGGVPCLVTDDYTVVAD